MHEDLPQLNITQSELAHRVAGYFDTLLAQRDAILKRYNLTPETADEFCNLQSTDADREKMLALYEKMVYVIEHKQIPPSEVLVLERIKEQERIDEFFGKDVHIEVPPLPETITLERIEQWKQKRFELRYLPPLTLNEGDNYPGWKKKPTIGINLFENLARIKNLPENQDNQNLVNLAPNQLIGCWMLIDTRSKPNEQRFGKQKYKADTGIKTIIKKLVMDGVVDQKAEDGRRNFIRHTRFNNLEFWEPFYDYLGVSKEEAIIRLPRVIEQSVFGQMDGWDGTNTWEWAEEYFYDFARIMAGRANMGGVSSIAWAETEQGDIGFRCVVVFSSH